MYIDGFGKGLKIWNNISIKWKVYDFNLVCGSFFFIIWIENNCNLILVLGINVNSLYL